MRVLITGATGFLGGRVAAETRRRGHEALAPGRDACDLAEPGAVARAVADLAPDAVVHLAAMADVGPCRDDPARARRVNAEAAGELASACAERALRLVHVSTDQVLDGTRSGWREDDPVRPLHVYGETKAEGERLVATADPSAAIVRPGLVTGLAPEGRRSASTWLRAEVAAGRRPTLFVDEWRTPVAADDVARALLDLAEGDAAGPFHCGGPRRLSRWELAVLELGSDAVIAPGARPPDRPEDLSLDSSRLVDLLGWAPRTLA